MYEPEIPSRHRPPILTPFFGKKGQISLHVPTIEEPPTSFHVMEDGKWYVGQLMFTSEGWVYAPQNGPRQDGTRFGELVEIWHG